MPATATATEIDDRLSDGRRKEEHPGKRYCEMSCIIRYCCQPFSLYTQLQAMYRCSTGDQFIYQSLSYIDYTRVENVVAHS